MAWGQGQMFRIAVLGFFTLAVPGSIAAQLGPQFPDDGFLSAAAVSISDAASTCVTEIEPADLEVVSYSTCAMIEFDTLLVSGPDLVLAARYTRWVRS